MPMFGFHRPGVHGMQTSEAAPKASWRWIVPAGHEHCSLPDVQPRKPSSIHCVVAAAPTHVVISCSVPSSSTWLSETDARSDGLSMMVTGGMAVMFAGRLSAVMCTSNMVVRPEVVRWTAAPVGL